MSIITTRPADKSTMTKIEFSILPNANLTQETIAADFRKVEKYISKKPLRRPNRTHPILDVTNEQLLKAAENNPPPQEWYDTDEECPF